MTLWTNKEDAAMRRALPRLPEHLRVMPEEASQKNAHIRVMATQMYRHLPRWMREQRSVDAIKLRMMICWYGVAVEQVKQLTADNGALTTQNEHLTSKNQQLACENNQLVAFTDELQTQVMEARTVAQEANAKAWHAISEKEVLEEKLVQQEERAKGMKLDMDNAQSFGHGVVLILGNLLQLHANRGRLDDLGKPVVENLAIGVVENVANMTIDLTCDAADDFLVRRRLHTEDTSPAPAEDEPPWAHMKRQIKRRRLDVS